MELRNVLSGSTVAALCSAESVTRDHNTLPTVDMTSKFAICRILVGRIMRKIIIRTAFAGGYIGIDNCFEVNTSLSFTSSISFFLEIRANNAVNILK